MFLTNEKLLRRFKELLKSADRIDLASAWATEGAALDALKDSTKRKHPCRVRALIGIRGNGTTPDALDMLEEIGELRIVTGSRLFHPKVYIFIPRQGGRLAWVGSANFTGRGFGYNEEIVLETQTTQQIEDWFVERWKEAGPLEERVLCEYRESYRPPDNDWRDERTPPMPPSPVARNKHTPPRMFREPILQVLHEMGGRGARQAVFDQVHENMKSRLLRADYNKFEPHPYLKRWEQSVDVARYDLAQKGLIKRYPDIPHGTWELTEAGKANLMRPE